MTLNTRSGEVLSALTIISLALSTVLSGVTTDALEIIYHANAISEWAMMTLFCGFFCLTAVGTENRTITALARFISGCVWGTILLLLSDLQPLLPLFWMSVVFFSFDIFTAVIKGQSWIQRSRY